MTDGEQQDREKKMSIKPEDLPEEMWKKLKICEFNPPKSKEELDLEKKLEQVIAKSDLYHQTNIQEAIRILEACKDTFLMIKKETENEWVKASSVCIDQRLHDITRFTHQKKSFQATPETPPTKP